MTRRILRTRLSAAVAALALAGAAVLASAAPASAHDTLLGSDPADGSTVAALPGELTLTFSAELLGDQVGNAVEVTDAAGASLADGDVQVIDNTLVQPLLGTPSGVVSVLWRAVSSDGHPISGALSFTVEGTTPTPAPTVTETVTATPSAPTPSASATPAPAPADPAAALIPWLIVGGAVLLAGIIVAIVLAVRSRRNDTPQDPRNDGAGSGTDA